MDTFNLINTKTKKKNIFFHKKIQHLSKKCKNLLLLFIFILNIFIIYLVNKLKLKLDKIILGNKNESQNINNIDYRTNINILEESIFKQNDFCDNPNKYYNLEYENMIKLTDFSFKNISYQMYVYKSNDNFMSNEIIKTRQYEPKCMSNFYDVLQYYSKVKNISNNKDIYMLDIGGNIGAYPSFLGKLGYSVISFEASPRNYYILKKNYCHINRQSNIVIINRGISNKEKACNYYSQLGGIGNGILLCNEKKERITLDGFQWIKTFEVNIIKLSNFIPIIEGKNVVLIKLDIEGSEGLAIEDGIELISKYHVPYIFSEFSPDYLRMHGTDPKEFLELFIKNGYKISKEGFLNVSYISVDEVTRGNIYFIYNG